MKDNLSDTTTSTLSTTTIEDIVKRIFENTSTTRARSECITGLILATCGMVSTKEDQVKLFNDLGNIITKYDPSGETIFEATMIMLKWATP